MITGAHAIVYSADASADRALLGELLRGHMVVDVDGGWLVRACRPPRSRCTRPTGRRSTSCT